MTPLDLLLYSLALVPLLLVIALLVNLVLNNTVTHRHQVEHYGTPRPAQRGARN